MVGAKEFAIKRKVIEKKKKNPLVDGIAIPKFMSSHESDIKNIAGSFLDKFKNNTFGLPKTIERKEIMIKRFPKMAKPHDFRTINPILEDCEGKESIVGKKPRQNNSCSSVDRDGFNGHSLFDLFNMGEEDHHEEHAEPKNISDELANQITYKVFQNINHYLKRDSEKKAGNRQIKLEISL